MTTIIEFVYESGFVYFATARDAGGEYVPLAEYATLAAERDALRAALKPFAKLAGLSGFPKEIDVTIWQRSSNVSEDDNVVIMLSDCIAARRALRQAQDATLGETGPEPDTNGELR